MSVEREVVLAKLEGDINELKTEGKITGFKIYRIEKSLDDLKEVLERLTDVYNNQSMIQKDIISIFKEVSDIKEHNDSHRRSFVPIQKEINDHIASSKLVAKIGSTVIVMLTAVFGWTVNQTLAFTKENEQRISVIERTQIEQRLDAAALKDSVISIQQKLTLEKEALVFEFEGIRKLLTPNVGSKSRP